MTPPTDEVVTCLCTHHIFRVSDFGDGDVWLGWYTQPGPSSWRWRLVNAWRCLRGSDEWVAADMVLSPPEARRLAAALLEAGRILR